MSQRTLLRRDFLKMAVTALAAAATAPAWKISSALAAAKSWAGFTSPPPAGKTLADPDAGMGKLRNYQYQAAKYKGPKMAAITPTSKCANCMQFKKTADVANWAPCAILGSAWVYEEGVCTMYAKNPNATT